MVTLGSDRDYVITPAPCYHVADVLVDSVSVGPVVRYTFHDLQTSHTIAARFAISTHMLTASAGPNGGINASGVIHCGASRTFTITPAACYQIEDVRVDGVSVGPVTRYTFTNVQADHSIHASFVSGRPAVTASGGAHGTIVPSGVTTVNCHDNLGFTITPEAGYRVANVWVDGEPMGAVTGYTLADVTANHRIWANFDRSAPAILAARIREDASLVR
ncbi:MAG: hypothetical protein E6K81_03335 [Candidatus Eisenbacteria bacterium]|uniref:Uncharacterized protein n=1 Tax=Eiseniibacteriota bacterium TaxID=2212470 RepID=A0A538UD98_UNCEI|nr:MAG: hypothetical protein E6K81_03335 [Candidatus Eisenbacteria bacterium]